jgi:Ca2+-binding RTX toxin-like protein
LFGDVGADDLEGGSGDDQLTADASDTKLLGGGGTDGVSVSGISGMAILTDSSLNILVAGAGDSNLQGDAGDDTLQGGAGADFVYGGADDDYSRVAAAATRSSGSPGPTSSCRTSTRPSPPRSKPGPTITRRTGTRGTNRVLSPES